MARNAKGQVGPEDGKKFSSEYQPIRNGRKPKLVNGVISDLKAAGYEEVSNEQAISFISLLLNLEAEQVEHLSKNQNIPLYVQRVAKRLHTASDDKIMDLVETLLSRAHGRPRQSLDLTTHEDAALEREFTPEQIAQMQQVLNQGNAKQDSGGSISASKRRKGNP